MDMANMLGVIANIFNVIVTILQGVAASWVLIFGPMTIKDVYRGRIEKKSTQPLQFPKTKRTRFVRVTVGLALVVFLLTSFMAYRLNGSFISGIRNTNTAVLNGSVPYNRGTLPLSCPHVRKTTGKGVTWPDFILAVHAGCILVLTSWVGHIDALRWSTGALVAFPPGTYTISMSGGAYDIVPTASGRDKYCNDFGQFSQASVKLLKPLVGWKPCWGSTT